MQLISNLNSLSLTSPQELLVALPAFFFFYSRPLHIDSTSMPKTIFDGHIVEDFCELSHA